MALNRSRGTARLLFRPYWLAAKDFFGQDRQRGPGVSALPRFPFHDPVVASVIIPVFNHWQDTLNCLDSIARLTGEPSYEIIVVDDGSSDQTATMLGQIDGLRVVRNEGNLGFVSSCNRGAEVARGEYLVFLNNDTVVTADWLRALVQTFRDIPEAGLVGGKLVYPNGRLQEAGGVIYRDASGSNYGKFDDPDHPRYNFARDVDYCSGACVMIPRTLFKQCGGFDAIYKPAYYEDTDLAFKVRHAGHKVVYQPLARIIHHEGLTSGLSARKGVKSYQEVNRGKFRERWHDRLADYPEPTGGPIRIVRANGPEGGSGHGRAGQVLVIDHRLPTPDRDSGSLRIFEIIRAIRSRGHHVAFLPDDLAVRSPYQQALQAIGVEVIHHPYYRSVRSFLRQHGDEFDLVILSRAEIAARHMAVARRLARRAKIVFDTVDLHFLREERSARLQQAHGAHAAAVRRKRQELELVRAADMTLVVSPIERELIGAECPDADVRILSNILPLDERPIPGHGGRRTIVFIGGFEHPPNTDAVLYFARDIFPMVAERIPEAVFQVIGSSPTPEVLKLAGSRIEVLGYVPDVGPYFDQARLSVAPLRYGAGVKGKVNQSMALGVPVVLTSMAAEGMGLVHGQHALIADDDASFASAMVHVWTSSELWEQLSRSGRQHLREHFSVQAATRRIDDLLIWAGLHGAIAEVSTHRNGT